MKRSLMIALMFLLLLSGAYAANTAPQLGGEIGMANEEFIGPGDSQGRPQTPAQSMYQAFVLEPQTYTYLYAGFMKDKPNSNPNVIPASLASYQMIDLAKILSPGDVDYPGGENLAFITDPVHPLWVWWRIKSNNLVKISLIFEKFYLDGDKTGPNYTPYVVVYHPDGNQEIAKGGWRPKSKGGQGKTGYTEIGVDTANQTAAIVLMDEKKLSNTMRAAYYLIKVEAHYETPAAKASSLVTGEYKMPLKVRIEVK